MLDTYTKYILEVVSGAPLQVFTVNNKTLPSYRDTDVRNPNRSLFRPNVGRTQ